MPSAMRRKHSPNAATRKIVPTRRSSRILLRKVDKVRKKSRIINDRRSKMSSSDPYRKAYDEKRETKTATTVNPTASHKRVLPQRSESGRFSSNRTFANNNNNNLIKTPTPKVCTCYNPPSCPVHPSQQAMITASGISVTLSNAQLSLSRGGHAWTTKPNDCNVAGHENSYSTSSNEPITLPAIFQGQLIIPQPYVNSLNQIVSSQKNNNFPFASLTKRENVVVASGEKKMQFDDGRLSPSGCQVITSDNGCFADIEIPDEPTPPPSCQKRDGQCSPDENRRKPAVRKETFEFGDKKPKTNWSPIGKPVKRWVYLKNDERPVRRLCFNSIKHNVEKDIIRLRDCVVINSDDNTGSVYVGKVAEFFEDPRDSTCSTGWAKTLRVSLVWYYSPRQTSMGKQYWQMDNELLASRHLDVIPADCIQDLVFVLTLNEYNRYCAENLNDTLWPRRAEHVPRAFKRYHRRRLMPTEDAPEETVFFCRQYYDFTGKSVLRNPT